jgi:hypothetical protein
MKLARLALALSMAALPLLACGQTDLQPYRLTVDYDRPGLIVPHWKISIPPRGAAEYTGKPDKGIDPGIVTFRISDAGRARLGDLLVHSKGLQPCETKSKGLANMGLKAVTFSAGDGPEVHCTFNYTDNKTLGQALDYVIALAGTLQAGLELDRLHRFDRLGLDPAIQRLSDDVRQGRAVEMGAIRPTLESLVTDPALLDRVRARAQQLLDLAKEQEKVSP